MRFYPHLNLPLWIRGRILPTLDERARDGGDPALQEVLERGLREERRALDAQAQDEESRAGARDPSSTRPPG